MDCARGPQSAAALQLEALVSALCSAMHSHIIKQLLHSQLQQNSHWGHLLLQLQVGMLQMGKGPCGVLQWGLRMHRELIGV